jgi:hypothetical protein
LSHAYSGTQSHGEHTEGSLGECGEPERLSWGALSAPENQTTTARFTRSFDVAVPTVCLEMKIK